MEQQKLDVNIEALRLENMEPHELEATAAALPEQAMQLRRDRKKLRYHLYRFYTEAIGGAVATGSPEELKKHFESQPLFDGWRFFGITWDVAMDDPMRVVHRDKSVAEEWEEIIRNKIPVLLPGGGLKYPDKKVQKAIEEHAHKKG